MSCVIHCDDVRHADTRLAFVSGLGVVLLTGWLLAAGVACADAPIPVAATAPDLTQLSLEQLVRLDVTIANKSPHPWFETPAAVAVITADDIRRSGATSIPEALRLAPGFEVARVDGHTWAISARGFNSIFSRDLLVMIDGRSVYTPLFSGVFWDVQDVLMEDIDRIEVVRGPGGTLWGANAVNGVVNVITKSARDTQGGLITAGGGTEERAFGAAQYGGKISDEAYYRVYLKAFLRDEQVFDNGHKAADDWWQQQGGFRLDWEPPGNNRVTFQGDMYGGQQRETFSISTTNGPSYGRIFNDRITVAGGNILSRWTHKCANDSEFALQLYFDRTERDLSIFGEKRNTFDIDFQHRWRLGERQEIVWGLGYRASHDDIKTTDILQFDPPHRTVQLGSAFLQDQITLVPDRLALTLGSKFEHNDFTGFEIQPSGRLSWTPTHRQTVWAAISRAVRTPTRVDQDMARFDQEPQLQGTDAQGRVVWATPRIRGNPGMDSEKLIAYEVGYRVQPHDRVTLDFAGFYDVYNDVRSVQNGTMDPSQYPLIIQNLEFGNQLQGHMIGGEVVSQLEIAPWWRLQATYSLLCPHISATRAGTVQDQEHSSPKNQAGLRSLLDLPGHWEFDCGVRYVDHLQAGHWPSYIVADVRLAWKPTKHLELAIVGQNLGDDHHPEFGSEFDYVRTQVQQSVYGKVTWRF